MSPGDLVVISGIRFGNTLVGLIFRPYEAYRRIIKYGGAGELVYIALLLAVYFAFASLVKTAALRPFLLTGQFITLVSSVGATYLLVVAALWLAGQWVGGKGTLKPFAIAWGYTLIPTLVWFLVTSLLYVILPPPRTTSGQGIIFSFLYLVFSAVLFFWKATLAYFALRFGMRLSLGKICLVLLIALPFVGLYSMFMYRLGVFKVPFI